jgi:hypothetical protein
VFLGIEALKIGSGGISQVAKLSGADWKTASHQEDGAGRRASRAGLCTSSVNKKTLEGASHTDRDQQCAHKQLRV